MTTDTQPPSTAPGPDLDVEGLRMSFALLAPQAERLVERFYETMFTQHPEVKPLFEGVDMAHQRRKLLASLKLVVELLSKPQELTGVLRQMGRRHQAYGIGPELYPVVSSTLRSVMAELAGDAWTEELDSAWEQALDLVSQTMIDAYEVADVPLTGTDHDPSPPEEEPMQAERDERSHREYETGHILVTDSNVRTRLQFLALTEEDLGVIKTWSSVCLAKADDLVDEFYDHIKATRETQDILDRHTTVERQRPALTRYAATLFQGRIDDEYLEYRRRVGVAHDNIDLDSNWYVAMYEIIRRVMVAAVEEAGATRAEIDHFRDALARLIQTDIALCITALTDSRRDKIEGLQKEQTETMANLMAEIRQLVEWAQTGELEKRADAGKFDGEPQQLIQSLNEMLDAILQPITEAADVLVRVAERDLTIRVQGAYRGDLARIKDAINSAVTNLDDGLSQVAVSARQVNAASDQISAGSQTLAQGATEQASSLEEVGSSLQELTSMAKQNSANSQEARALADTARASAERGVDSMNRLSEAVQGIKTSSDETAKIVKTIDEIAFQTNLLALNAAVEAARAGEAGRGFAVVAEEVRNLAMRSAEAAKNTADLIDESVKNAEGGVNTNEEVLSNLAEIREGVNKVGDVMTEIAAGSDQQSEGISQINVAVDQMNKVTQQNAANSEESASAAEELSAQATEMQSLVATYQLSQVQVQGQPQASLQMKGQRAPHAAPAPPLGVRVEPEGQGPNGGLPPNGHGSPDAHDFPLDDEEVATLKEF